MIEIYRDFELVTAEVGFKDFQWRRRFSKPGEFQLETHFTKEKFIDFFAPQNVIYMRHLDEAAFIERRSIVQTVEDELLLVIHGRSIESIPERRVFTASGSYDLSVFLTSVINNNFLAAAGNLRQIPSMRLTAPDLPAIPIIVDLQQRNAGEEFTNLLEENNLGMKIRYNISEKTYDLQFYEPMRTDVIFSREFNNVTQQDYVDDEEKYKNVVYVENVYTYNDMAYTGLDRREMAISKPSEDAATYERAAMDALNGNRKIKTISNVINAYSKQFIYLQDWDVGSIVLSQNDDLGFSESGIITEITEFYTESGVSYEVNIGSYAERKK